MGIEKIQIDKALIQCEKFIQGIFTSAPVVIFLIDRDEKILFTAGRDRGKLRCDPINIGGQSLRDVFADVPLMFSDIPRALQGETLTKLIDIDGYRFDIQYNPFHNDHGEIIGVLGVARDVTLRRETEDALYTTEARFQTIFEEAGIGIALEDFEGRIIECNPAYQEMLGYSGPELRNRLFQEFTYPADLPENVELYRSMVSGERDSFRIEKRYIRKDGQIVWGQITTSLVWGPDGKPQAIIVMVENITARKQVEADLIEVQRKLMQSREQERLSLAQDLHDGPLQEMYGINYQLKDLEDFSDDPVKIKQIQEIQSSLQRQIQTLRTFCGDLRPPVLVPFGLEKTIRSHLENVRVTHPHFEIDLDLMRDGNRLSEEVRLTLFRIFRELLNNIVRHSEATHIGIGFHFDEHEVVLEIRDNGQGFKVPDRWVELARGGHLGLVGAQERAETIGGRLVIKSKPGQGTMIRVIVPLNLVEEKPLVEETLKQSFNLKPTNP